MRMAIWETFRKADILIHSSQRFSECPKMLRQTGSHRWGNQVYYSAVTAIVVIHTSEGFIIGADGRRMDSVTKTIEIENARKVFLFESGAIRLSYAWTGTTQAFGTGGPVYDLLAATKEVLPLVASGSKDFVPFLSEFCKALSTRLPLQMTNMPKEELARVILVGYFQGKSFSAQIQVLYPLSFLMVYPEVQFPAQYQKTIFSGAESIFPSYAGRNPQSGAEAINFVREYIRECADSANPDCVGIGGHIHIAEVKPEQSRWVIEPSSD
jgi:hypothetical protein